MVLVLRRLDKITGDTFPYPKIKSIHNDRVGIGYTVCYLIASLNTLLIYLRNLMLDKETSSSVVNLVSCSPIRMRMTVSPIILASFSPN